MKAADANLLNYSCLCQSPQAWDDLDLTPTPSRTGSLDFLSPSGASPASPGGFAFLAYEEARQAEEARQVAEAIRQAKVPKRGYRLIELVPGPEIEHENLPFPINAYAVRQSKWLTRPDLRRALEKAVVECHLRNRKFFAKYKRTQPEVGQKWKDWTKDLVGEKKHPLKSLTSIICEINKHSSFEKNEFLKKDLMRNCFKATLGFKRVTIKSLSRGKNKTYFIFCGHEGRRK